MFIAIINGRPVPPTRRSTMVLYDPISGDIHHVHEFITLPRARASDLRARKSVALAAATEAHTKAKPLEALDLGELVLDPKLTYRVEVGSRRLVQVAGEGR
jgi:hypothetical protein